ncbi:MAG: DUF6365 family protein [Acidobacteriota bacterium]|nr:DUF6365 family protein [Acidobacteriota bacterium]
MKRKRHLILALSRGGWGETAFGIRLADDLYANGEEPVFIVHTSGRRLLCGRPFVAEEVADNIEHLLELLIASYLEEGRWSSIILADFFTADGVLRRAGVDPMFLQAYGIPIVAIDTWNLSTSNRPIDLFLDKERDVADWIQTVNCRLVPVPIVSPAISDSGVCHFLPQPSRTTNRVRQHVRENLGLKRLDLAILFCTASWQQTTYDDQHGDRLAEAVPNLLMQYVSQLGSQVHLIHVGPRPVAVDRKMEARYHWLGHLPAAQFDPLLGSVDLLLSANVSGTTVIKAIVSGLPVVVVENSFTAGSQLSTFPFALSENTETWLRDAQPLYPFRLWPLGFYKFLAPILDGNPFQTTVNTVELLDEVGFGSACRELLFDRGARERTTMAQEKYIAEVSGLPTPLQVLRQASIVH